MSAPKQTNIEVFMSMVQNKKKISSLAYKVIILPLPWLLATPLAQCIFTMVRQAGEKVGGQTDQNLVLKIQFLGVDQVGFSERWC